MLLKVFMTSTRITAQLECRSKKVRMPKVMHTQILWKIQMCRNPSLGLATKARVCKSAGQERSPGVWESVKMNTHTPKWTPT
jgi:hypothetical protein